MSYFLSVGVPVIALMILAFGVPYVWARIVPEGIPGLVINFALSAFVISLAVFAYFITFYADQYVPLVEDLIKYPGAFGPYFLAWAGKTSLIWLPLLVLGIAAQPKRWKEVVW